MTTRTMVYRAIVAISVFLTVGSCVSSAGGPVAAWHFEPEAGDSTLDSVGGIQDTLHGNYKFSPKGVEGQCLKLDGFSSYVERSSDKAPSLTGAFSIEAWVALQEYPWNWTAIVDRQSDRRAGCFFGLDYQGALGMGIAVDGKWVECDNASRYYYSILHTDRWDSGSIHTMVRTDSKFQFSVCGVGDLEAMSDVPSDTWTHVAVVYSRSERACRFYMNGKLDNSVRVRRPVKAVLDELEIGGWSAQDRFYRGRLDDLRIYGRVLDATEIVRVFSGSGPDDTVAWWKFDETSGKTAVDSAGKSNGTLNGGKFVSGKVGNALDLDGNDQYLTVPSIGSYDDVTLAVWIRPIITTSTMSLLTWNHAVGTFDPKEGINLYLNGNLVASKPVTGTVTEPVDTALLIGYSHEKLFPIQTERGPSMVGSHMLLSGLLDEVKIYDTVLSASDVVRVYESVKPGNPKPLDYNLMPTGTPGKGEFGASREELKYCESWDRNYRMSGPADVVVKFDELPVNYVFWHGWNYGLCMVSENGLLMADQSVERGNDNGCTEHMSDKQNRYSHVRIIENNDARVVVHWRYNPCDIFYKETFLDPATGWGDWVDEYFYIYPDGVMMREQNFWTSGYVEMKNVGGYGGNPSNQETIFFSQPGKGPLDTVEKESLTVVNDAGERASFSWQPDFPWDVGKKVEKPTIQMVNFKSRYRPYMIRRPGARIAAFPPSGFIDRNYPYWNHWPVSQLPNDGRKGTRTDRPAHTSLTWFVEPPIRAEGILYTWIYVYGLTDKVATELVPLSKSWNSPAEMTVRGDGFESKGYDTCQRAYVLNTLNQGKTSQVELSLAGSESSPVVNPAFVIQGWGEHIPTVAIDGKPVARGKDCRLGVDHKLDGADLVVWLKLEAGSAMTITFVPEK